MRIIQVTPSGQKSKSGNRTTANRWASIFRSLGHSVLTITNYDDRPADMMVAIHAWRSARSIERFKALYPEKTFSAMSRRNRYKRVHTQSPKAYA